MILLLLFFSALPFARSACPDGFDIVGAGECRGKYSRISTFYDSAATEAIANCKEIEGQPIIIHNEEEQAYWIGRPYTNTYAVIGLVCNTHTWKWEWEDGSAQDFWPSTYDAALNKSCVTGGTWELLPNDKSNQKWYFFPNGHSAQTVDIYCTSQLPPLPVHSEDGCDNFEIDGDDGVCYQVGITALNHQHAQMICRERGANLASIHSLEENSFVRELAVSKGDAVAGIYLGATKSGKGGKFKWEDGSNWDYDNFYPGFPVSDFGDCLMMDTEGTMGEWANVDCSTELSVACARPQNYSEPHECKSGPWSEGELIHSPGFPFDASTPCDFIMSVDAGKRVQVEILLLEANTYSDKLLIFEDYYLGTVIANLTGKVDDGLYNTTSSNYARVSWQPNGAANVRGLLMTFRGIE